MIDAPAAPERIHTMMVSVRVLPGEEQDICYGGVYSHLSYHQEVLLGNSISKELFFAGGTKGFTALVKIINEINKKKEVIVVKDLALKIQSEVNIASNSEDGYRRNFEIPEFIDYINFSINVNETHVLVESRNAN